MGAGGWGGRMGGGVVQHKKINVIWHINRTKEKHTRSSQLIQKKHFTEFHTSKVRILKLGTEGNLINMTKAICEKHIVDITLSGKRLMVFPLRSRTRQGCPLLPFHSTQYWKF